ncbi:DUF2339 domain-containing protein [Patescibacteria group bacterium]|nr:MAG: DUF2339 domain-containing protein [Patescibacteria group bacterium]
MEYILFLVVIGIVGYLVFRSPKHGGTGDASLVVNRLASLLIQKGIITKDELYGTGSAPTPSASSTTPAPAPTASDMSQPAAAPTSPVTASAAPAPSGKGAATATEFAFNTKWLMVAGIIAILFGVGFFIKFSFDNNLIGETGRVILGLIIGLGFIGTGEWFYRKYPKYAFFLTGGGIAILYLSLYSAFGLYHMVEQLTAFLGMILVTLFSVVLSVRYNSVAIAGIALLGGFLTPILVSSSTVNDIGLLTYITLLDLGLFALAYFRNWKSLVWGCALGTLLLVGSWFFGHYDSSKLFMTEFYFTLYWAIFTGSTLVFYYFNDRKPSNKDFALMLVTGLLYMSVSYGILNADYSAYMGLLPLFLTAVYTVIALFGSYVKEGTKALVYLPAGMAVLFLTLVFPIQFQGYWITISWFVEAGIIAWVGHLLRSRMVSYSIPIFALGLFRLFAFDTYLSQENFFLIFNERFVVFAVAVVLALFVAYIFHTFYRDTKIREDLHKAAAFMAIANILILCAGVFEIVDWFRFVSSTDSVAQSTSLAISVFFIIYALIAIVLGIVSKTSVLRICATVVFGITVLKTFLYDIWLLEAVYRIIAFMALGIALVVVGYLYFRFSARIKGFLTASDSTPVV